MDAEEYRYMYELEDSLWWYAGMRRIVAGLLEAELPGGGPLSVLDAGCGTGGSLRLLNRYGQVTGLDFSPLATELYRTRESGRVVVASADTIPFADASFDLVTSFDVICQLPEPANQQAVQEMARVLKPGGTLLARVPAIQALYGPHDRAVQSYHRYHAGELREIIERQGLEVLRLTYANSILLPVAAVRRLLSRLSGDNATGSDVRPLPAPLNAALEAVLSSEAYILKRTSLPIGLSLLAVARKS